MENRFTLSISLEGEAFETYPGRNLAKILRELARRFDEVADGEIEGKLLDYNGNTCGEWNYSFQYEDEPEAEEVEDDPDIYGDEDDDEEETPEETREFTDEELCTFSPGCANDALSAVLVRHPTNGMKAWLPLPFDVETRSDAEFWLKCRMHDTIVEKLQSEINDDCEADILRFNPEVFGEVNNLCAIHAVWDDMTEDKRDMARALLFERLHPDVDTAGDTIRRVARDEISGWEFSRGFTIREIAEQQVDDSGAPEWLINYVDIDALARDLKGEYTETPWGTLRFTGC